MHIRKLFTPFSAPIYVFCVAIGLGAVLLHHEASLAHSPISWIDALFTATSAVCVTGLIVVDTGSFFTVFGQTVILACIQLGGLGLMTYASLVFYLWRRRVKLGDRITVGQYLMHDPTFHLGRFLLIMFLLTLAVESAGAALLYARLGGEVSLYWAVFHSISAFCNAGFSLEADSLTAWALDPVITGVVMVLITLGGLGFSVLTDLASRVVSFVKRKGFTNGKRLSLHSRTVLAVSAMLTLGGGLALWASEAVMGSSMSLLEAAFQSVTCRTAGFNTVDVAGLSSLSLIMMMVLMFIGGSPGSCAGGVKTTTFRAVLAFIGSQFRGRRQTETRRVALDQVTVDRALTLFIFAVATVAAAVFILVLTEGSGHPDDKAIFLDLAFETVSAFGTVGLSTGVTPTLSTPGKLVLIVLMFVGRLGPILFLSLLQSWRRPLRRKLPEEGMLIG